MQIDVHVWRHTLTLTVNGNGQGLDGSNPSRGIGLRSMRERATRLRGQLHITSQNGAGTRVTLTVPLSRRNA
ncbi:MAG: hypothetical protein GEU99_19635 [Luteitalea sp.]|nr:hypothetical protein [Luteitalea sp.]